MDVGAILAYAREGSAKVNANAHDTENARPVALGGSAGESALMQSLCGPLQLALLPATRRWH